MKEQQERLDSKKIIAAISPANRRFLAGLDIFDSLASTNSYLLEQAKNRALLTLPQGGSRVCLAEQQTQGRGRQGKTWFSPYATNLYCSLTWSFPRSFLGLSALSLACAVIIIQALKNFGIQEGLGLKWPNDILFDGRKLAGILLENVVLPEQHCIVIGFGLNLSLPAEKNVAWIGVNEVLGKACSRNQLAGILLDAFFLGLPLFQEQGLKPFLALWRQHDLLLQQLVSLNTPLLKLQGTVKGINDQGELLLVDQQGKSHSFSYGEVSVSLAIL